MIRNSLDIAATKLDNNLALDASMISWDECRQEFAPDGALRDIYVHDTTIEHWRTLFSRLHAAYSFEYSIDGETCSFPAHVDDAFKTREVASPCLYLRVGDILVACHFFTTTEIELDISPLEVTSRAAFDKLLSFLQLVGDTLGKTVTMTYEGAQYNPFIIYDPLKREFQYHRAGT